MAAIGRSHPKAKVSELHYAALTAATRATDVPCAALTTDSDLSTIHSSCQALGRALGALDVQMNGATRAQLKALKNELDFPYRTVVVGHAHWAGPTTTVLYLLLRFYTYARLAPPQTCAGTRAPNQARRCGSPRPLVGPRRPGWGWGWG